MVLNPGLVLFIPAKTVLKLHSAAAFEAAESDGAKKCHLLAYAASANDNLYEAVPDSSCPAEEPGLVNEKISAGC